MSVGVVLEEEEVAAANTLPLWRAVKLKRKVSDLAIVEPRDLLVLPEEEGEVK